MKTVFAFHPISRDFVTNDGRQFPTLQEAEAYCNPAPDPEPTPSTDTEETQ